MSERSTIIAIGTDHHGFIHKQQLISCATIGTHRIEWLDQGVYTNERVDYPPFAQAVSRALQDNIADAGILLCGTGVGMAIAANRFKGIYAALVWNEHVARLSRQHDNANILVLPADYLSPERTISVVHAWLAVEFLGGRYAERIALIDRFRDV